jgi:hypothetical protein
MIEPRLVRRESVLRLYFVFGKCIEQPHAFIGVDRVAEEEHKKRKQKSGSFQHEDSRAAENPRQLAD